MCAPGYFFLRDTQNCRPCPLSCTACESATKCTACDRGFEVQKSTSVCTEICGDGLRFLVSCDDGNLIDGDGCSSSCTVEQGYKCEGGSSTSKDVCTYVKPEAVTITQLGQSINNNRITITVKVKWLPSTLTSDDCRRCSSALLVTVSQCPYQPQVNTSYIPGTSYNFAITIDMQPNQLCNFVVKVQIHPALQTPHFTGVDISNVLTMRVGPATLPRLSDAAQP